MARPAKTGLDWFQHETDAATDDKVEPLCVLYGNDGYAFYFITLERIYRTANQELSIADTESRKLLATKCRLTLSRFEKILATALARGLFDFHAYSERGVLTSDGIKRRAARFMERRAPKPPSKSHGNSAETDSYCAGNSAETDSKYAGNVPALSRATVQHSTAQYSTVQHIPESTQGVGEDARAKIATGKPEQPDPSVVAIRLSDGTVVIPSDGLARECLTAMHLPDAMLDVVQAWIETHDGRAPSQHDVRALRKRVEDLGSDTVTLALRRSGNAGKRSIVSLDVVLGEIRREQTRAAREANA